MVILLVVALGILALGAVVLLRFPDRPGGKIAWRGFEVSSVGAGLPLIVLGLAGVMLATFSDDGPNSPTGDGPPPPENGRPACLGRYLRADPVIPTKWMREVNLDVEDLEVLGPSDPKGQFLGLVLLERSKVIGAVKVRYLAGPQQFEIASVTNGRCEPLDWAQVDSPQVRNPTLLPQYSTLRFPFFRPAHVLELRGGPDVDVELHRT